MIPKTAPCRCGQAVDIRGGSWWSESPGKPRRSWWFAGGECPACRRIVQYGHGGTPSDYMHGRFWYIGKHAESAPGRVRRWPTEWGFTQGETLQ